MSEPICFMIRNRAQGADMIEHVLASRRAFIGYPPHKLEHNVGEINLKAGLHDLSRVKNWQTVRQSLIKIHSKNYARQIAGNLNLIKDAVPGSIILIPRPDRGLVYAGTLDKFELLDAPRLTKWGESYIQNRITVGLNKHGDDMATHVQDLAQSFLIKEKKWIEIPFIGFPVWMQRTFFGRSTTARLRGMKGATDVDNLKLAFEEARRFMEEACGRKNVKLIPDWTSDHEIAKQRIRDNVSAESLEHLIVALLQLEYEDEQWMQCGGSGDGGVDGIGATKNGGVSLLQCKWEFWSRKFSFGETLHGTKDSRRYFAYLNGVEQKDIEVGEGIEIWDADEITRYVLKYSAQLTMAMALRIKSPSHLQNSFQAS